VATLNTYIVDSYIYANNNKKEHIVAFPWQQWLFEHAIMYCGAYFVYLVTHSFTGIPNYLSL